MFVEFFWKGTQFLWFGTPPWPPGSFLFLASSTWTLIYFSQSGAGIIAGNIFAIFVEILRKTRKILSGRQSKQRQSESNLAVNIHSRDSQSQDITPNIHSKYRGISVLVTKGIQKYKIWEKLWDSKVEKFTVCKSVKFMRNQNFQIIIDFFRWRSPRSSSCTSFVTSFASFLASLLSFLSVRLSSFALSQSVTFCPSW